MTTAGMSGAPPAFSVALPVRVLTCETDRTWRARCGRPGRERRSRLTLSQAGRVELEVLREIDPRPRGEPVGRARGRPVVRVRRDHVGEEAVERTRRLLVLLAGLDGVTTRDWPL